MIKNYKAKIIAKDSEGLQMISAYCTGATVKINEMKYLSQNKIFLLFLERSSKDENNKELKINSICKFEFVDNVKSKNINQNDRDLFLELLAIDIIKIKENYEINLIFSNNAYIIMSTEITEVTLEDQD